MSRLTEGLTRLADDALYYPDLNRAATLARRRRTVAVTAAAAVLVLGGGTTGAAAVLGRQPAHTTHGPRIQTAGTPSAATTVGPPEGTPPALPAGAVGRGALLYTPDQDGTALLRTTDGHWYGTGATPRQGDTPMLSADGRYLFSRTGDGPVVRDLTGTRTLDAPGTGAPLSWSPDGHYALFATRGDRGEVASLIRLDLTTGATGDMVIDAVLHPGQPVQPRPAPMVRNNGNVLVPLPASDGSGGIDLTDVNPATGAHSSHRLPATAAVPDGERSRLRLLLGGTGDTVLAGQCRQDVVGGPSRCTGTLLDLATGHTRAIAGLGDITTSPLGYPARDGVLVERTTPQGRDVVRVDPASGRQDTVTHYRMPVGDRLFRIAGFVD